MTPSQKRITEGYKAIYEVTRSDGGLAAKSIHRHARKRLENRAEVLLRDGLPDETVARAVGLSIDHIRTVRERRIPAPRGG